MIESPYKDIINALVKASKKQAVTWTKTSSRNEYKATLPSGFVTIYWLPEEEADYAPMDDPDAFFVIFNNNGDEIYRFSCCGRGDADFEILTSLYNAARNSYLQVDKTLSGLLSDLEYLG